MLSTRLPKPRLSGASRIGTVLAGSAATLLASALLSATPWPSALLIRRLFEAGARATVKEMLPYVPASGVSARLDVPVDLPTGISSLDVFTPSDAAGPRPTVVWIHGGAWISGSKTDVAPYLRILASHGYTMIGLNYPVAPGATYPTAVAQLNDTLTFIVENADDLAVDPTRIILAGDSAGAQLASQLAALTTNPSYAQRVDIRPALSTDQLIGAILHCGIYDLGSVAELRRISAWGFRTALWAYTGTKDWANTYVGTVMSTINFVTEDFPPTFLSGGNGDGLTSIQAVPMSAALKRAGVTVTDLFWPEAHEPALPHEYQFHLDRAEARAALEHTVSFLDRLTR